MIIYFIISALLIAIDQITKWLTVNFLKPISNIDLIPRFLSLTYVENRGAAFGIMQNSRWFFVIITLIFLIGLTIYAVKSKERTKLFCISSALVFAGAIGNLIDRVLSGYVVDMIRVHLFDFPVFNFADCCIVIGMILLCWAIGFQDNK